MLTLDEIVSESLISFHKLLSKSDSVRCLFIEKKINMQ